MNEIQRLQQLAGIITEIKVNNPNNKFNATVYYKTSSGKPKIIKIEGFETDNGTIKKDMVFIPSSLYSYQKNLDFIKSKGIEDYEDLDSGILIPIKYFNIK